MEQLTCDRAHPDAQCFYESLVWYPATRASKRNYELKRRLQNSNVVFATGQRYFQLIRSTGRAHSARPVLFNHPPIPIRLKLSRALPHSGDPCRTPLDRALLRLKMPAVGFRNECQILEIAATTKTEKSPQLGGQVGQGDFLLARK